MRKLNYNKAEVSVTLDGQSVVNIADGDTPIRIIPNDTTAALTVGLDGTMLSFANNKNATFEMDLLPISPNLDQCYSLYTSQQTEQARTFDITIATGVGEFHSLKGCAISNVGEIQTGGNEGQLRTISIVVSQLTLDHA